MNIFRAPKSDILSEFMKINSYLLVKAYTRPDMYHGTNHDTNRARGQNGANGHENGHEMSGHGHENVPVSKDKSVPIFSCPFSCPWARKWA